uniref:No apical meristem-associated C-terminal domain-containing protein n=1 Tax=Oryza brachyantha TaxID=4533 RepID=J3L8T1_ORYBR
MQHLKGHWHKTTKKVSLFKGCYSQLRDAYASGRSDGQLMEQALEMYQSRQGTQFQYVHWWKAVADSPKWNVYISSGGSGHRKHTPDLNRAAENMVRPIGIKRAKKTRGTSSEVASEAKEHLKSLVDAHASQREEILLGSRNGTFGSKDCNFWPQPPTSRPWDGKKKATCGASSVKLLSHNLGFGIMPIFGWLILLSNIATKYPINHIFKNASMVNYDFYCIGAIDKLPNLTMLKSMARASSILVVMESLLWAMKDDATIALSSLSASGRKLRTKDKSVGGSFRKDGLKISV